MEKINQILENPKTFWERILRMFILLLGGCAGAAGIFIFVWIAWIIFGN